MKQKIGKELRNKNIFLFGVQEETINFYKNYNEMLHIKYCVTSYIENVKLQPLKEYGLETKLYDDIELTKDDLLIICDYECYQPIERRLKNEGIIEYSGFISSKLAEGILEEKKIAVLMGSEFIGQLAMGLQMLPEIQENCFCVFYPENELLKAYKNRMAEYMHIARVCDIYIVSVCDKNMYSAKVLSPEFLQKNCIKVRISDYTFNGYFPQIKNDRDVHSDFLFRERKRLPISYNTLFLAREDMNLRRYIDNNVAVEEILSRVSSPDFYTKEQVECHFKEALGKLKRSDEAADIPLAKFVENCCVGMVGYRNLDEWNANVLIYVMKKVCKKIGIELKRFNEHQFVDLIEKTSGSELPVYPSVLKHLNIENYNDKKYKVVSYYQVRYLNFEEYIRFCVMCMYQIKELDEFLGIRR